MSTHKPDPGVPVVAELRPHPALRKLARACITLARLQVTPPETEDTSTTTPSSEVSA